MGPTKKQLRENSQAFLKFVRAPQSIYNMVGWVIKINALGQGNQVSIFL